MTDLKIDILVGALLLWGWGAGAWFGDSKVGRAKIFLIFEIVVFAYTAVLLLIFKTDVRISMLLYVSFANIMFILGWLERRFRRIR
jgi:hypothetical protein